MLFRQTHFLPQLESDTHPDNSEIHFGMRLYKLFAHSDLQLDYYRILRKDKPGASTFFFFFLAHIF